MGDHRGLSTEKALQKLCAIISEEVHVFMKSKEQSLGRFVTGMFSSDYIPFTKFSLILLVFEVVLLLIVLMASNNTRLVSISFELVLLVLFSIILVVCCIREHHLKEHEMERLIQSVVAKITYDPKNPWSYEHYPDLALPETNSISLIWTYRDGRIVNLPHNLLVEEDIIILGPSRVAPAECRQLSTATSPRVPVCSVKLEPGDIFNPAIDSSDHHSSYLPHPRQKFEVIQAPVKAMIRSFLASSAKKKSSILNKRFNAVMGIFETYIIWIVFLISLLVNILRWQLLPDDTGDYSEMLILIQVYTILPLLPLVYPVLWVAITLYGTARLRILFHMYSKRRFDPAESEEISLDHVNCEKVLTFFWKMVVGDPQGLPRTVNMLHTFGSITRYCCVDKEGILCYPSPVPEKIFFFRDQKKLKHSFELENLLEETQEFSPLDVDKESSKKGVKKDCCKNDIEVMNISPDPKSPYGIQFDDVEWEELLSSLKPLGINMLFNSSCQHPIKSLQLEDFSRHLSLAGNQSVVPNFRGCLCSMAKQIGFKDRILNMFKNKQQLMAYRPLYLAEDKTSSNFFLSIVKEKHVPMIIGSVINEGKHGVSQLLAQGSADLILEACSEFWNGDEICSLTDTERKKALSFFQRMSITRKCVAFSYRPIFQEDYECEDIFFEYPSMVERRQSEDVSVERTTPRKSSPWMRKVRADIKCEEILEHAPVPPKDISGHVKNMQQQIFLGMVTLTHSLKEGVVTMVEQLNNAGIRFVHFSYDNELLSRVFCQRLGLETGWNCHISLKESHGTTNYDDNSSTSDSIPQIHDEELLDGRDHGKAIGSDSFHQARNSSIVEDGETTSLLHHHHYEKFDELYFMSDRSKLPKGIQSMRAHLECVDDVPLLVPLFTDCNSDAVAEMINIMQEYDEIVCCTGSVLNVNNYKIFASSDISIALEPIFHPMCFLKQAQPLHHGSLGKDISVSDPDVCENVSKQGPLSLSASLSNIPCSLSCERMDNFPIAALLYEARRLVTNCESCFLFLLSCQISLSLLMLFSSLMMLPPPLTGIQLLWLLCVIIPVLSVSLIGTPGGDDLMKTITGKCKKIYVSKSLIYPFMIQFVPTFVMNCTFIVICVFPWILNSFCSKASKYECHWLLGARNITTPWNGWYGNLKGGLFFAQDLILFYMTMAFIALSASFVHRKYLVIQKTPLTNKPWCLCIFICFLLQLLYTVCSIFHWNDERLPLDLHLTDVSHILYVLSIVWLSLLVVISEVCKRKYIRTNVRFQKRERLKFDTKLGMNSPV